tara:strand:+ start:1562 stop:1996 length:435 start_codon:yes stop_codon:yes gene_type:complete
MFFKSKKNKRISAVGKVFSVWITSHTQMCLMLSEDSKKDFDSFIKKDPLSIWYFIGASDSLTQREELLENDDFLKLTKEVFENLGFSTDVVMDCINSYVENSWNDEEFSFLMLGGQACNRFLSAEKDNSGMLEYIEKITERIEC